MTTMEESVKSDRDDSQLKSAQDAMLRTVDTLKTKLGTKSSSATYLAVLQENPCLVKCMEDLRSPSYANDIDRLYVEKHEFARTALVDRIAREFCGSVEVGAESLTKTGKLDVKISSNRIVLTNGAKTIGCEVKSGSSIKIAQLLRYLLEVDRLVVMRVPTRDVVIISQSDIKCQLEEMAKLIEEKASSIVSGDLYKVPGEWCYECLVECEHRKKKSKFAHVAKMDGLAGFIIDVGITIEKAIALVRQELKENDEAV